MKKRVVLSVLIAVLLLTQLIACDSASKDVTGNTDVVSQTNESISEKVSETPKKPSADTKPNSSTDTEPASPTPSTHLLMYSFSEDDLDGCTSENCKITVDNGIVHLVCDTESSPNRYDPKINICAADMPLTGADYTTCEIRCKYDVSNRTTHKTSTLFFWYGEGSNDFYYIEYNYPAETSGDEWITIKFDLSEMLLWKNFTISAVRWDPFECVGTCDIDYIAFYDGDREITEDDTPVETPKIKKISEDCMVAKDEECTLSVTASGGVAPYTYSWSDGTNILGTGDSITLVNSTVGMYSYTCTVTDADNRSVTSNPVKVTVSSGSVVYNFNTDGDNEGWNPNVCFGTAEVKNGTYHLVCDQPTVEGGARYDPQLTVSGLTLNGSEYAACKVKYKYDFGAVTSNYQATLFYWDSENTVKSIEVIPEVTVSEDYVTLTFDLAVWNSLTITNLRFDVCECPGTVDIDSIVFYLY